MEMNIKGVLKPTQVYKSNKKQNQTFEATDFKKKTTTILLKRGMVRRRRREEGSGWGTRVYL